MSNPEEEIEPGPISKPDKESALDHKRREYHDHQRTTTNSGRPAPDDAEAAYRLQPAPPGNRARRRRGYRRIAYSVIRMGGALPGVGTGGGQEYHRAFPRHRDH